jgi:flagellum-specific peptidoglycan hydrolase FlgJ
MMLSLQGNAQKQFEHLPPTKENILTVCKYHGIQFPKIVLAQAIQESGLKPNKRHNNLFGLSHSRGLYKFPHWSYSVKMYKDKIQSRYKSGNYLSFIDRIGYAEDPNYISKIKRIANSL